MTLATIALVVLAALIHATWNLLAKRAALVGPAFVFAYNLVSCIAYAPWLVWLLAHGRVAWTRPVVAAIVASGVIHLAYSLVLQRGYQVADFTVVYPVARGSGPMLASLAAVLLMGEAVTPLRLAGLAAIVAGILLISTRGDLRAFARPGGQAGLRWGAATGGLIASYTVIDAFAVKALGVPPVVLDWFGNFQRFFLLAPLVARDPRRALARMRGHWHLAVGVGLLAPLSYILVLGALSLGAPVTIVAPMRERSMMAAALMGMLFLKEQVGPARLLGCAILVGGVVLLGASG
jgi:drug/metabolite transporter (DMT)-like permease